MSRASFIADSSLHCPTTDCCSQRREPDRTVAMTLAAQPSTLLNGEIVPFSTFLVNTGDWTVAGGVVTVPTRGLYDLSYVISLNDVVPTSAPFQLIINGVGTSAIQAASSTGQVIDRRLLQLKAGDTVAVEYISGTPTTINPLTQPVLTMIRV